MQIHHAAVLVIATVSSLGGSATATADDVPVQESIDASAHGEPATSSVGRKLRGLLRPSNGIRANNVRDYESDEATKAEASTTRNLIGGCYETYMVGSGSNVASYNLDAYVSATIGNQKFNYKCISTAWCGVLGFGPGQSGEGLAWTKLTECSGTAPTESIPQPARWNGVGCPLPFNKNTDYEAAQYAVVDNLVYQCTAWPNSLFCSMKQYEPGTSQYWQKAWTMDGSCDPNQTRAPTPIPTSSPTRAPTPIPTSTPTSSPTLAPTLIPTSAPTSAPAVCKNSTQGYMNFPLENRIVMLENRYGKLKIKNQADLDDAFCVRRDVYTLSRGTNLLINKSAQIDSFDGYSAIGLSTDEVKTVCMSKCAENPLCDFIEILKKVEKSFDSNDVKDGFLHQCDFYNLDAGPIFLKEESNITSIYDCGCQSSVDVVVKKGKVIRDSADVECKIPHVRDLSIAIECATCYQKGNITACNSGCPKLLTSDFQDYLLPAAGCIHQASGGNDTAVKGCLDCLMGAGSATCLSQTANLCDTKSEYSTIYRNRTKTVIGSNSTVETKFLGCGNVCYPKECGLKLQKGMLCVSGAALSKGGNGCINKKIDEDGVTPAFTCPI